MTIFLVYFEAPTKRTQRLLDRYDAEPLRDGLWLVRTDDTQSRLYHDVKHTLKRDSTLLVAQLDHPPKFKKVHRGALKWVRDRFAAQGRLHLRS